MPGTERSVRIPMADGVELAATLFLPEGDRPEPCLLEALPYRKDDLTSSYADGYRAYRDDHRYAVARVDLRGTGSSGGDATDEYPLVERTDLCTVIAWLAEQDWCDGNVGMFGTSYSGFNSLQIAAERPPALKAIVSIYSSDDRWHDDVHWRGHALKLLDLVDYCNYMTPMCVLPPVPARVAGRLALGVAAAARHQRAVDADLAAREPGRRLLAGRLAAPRRVRRDRVPDDAGGRAGPTATATTPSAPSRGSARPACRGGCWPGRGRTPTRRPRSPGRGSTSTTRWSRGGTAGCGRPPPRRGRTARTSSCAPRPCPSPTSRCTRASGSPGRGRSLGPRRRPLLEGDADLVVRPDVGTSAWIDCAGHFPWGLSGDQRDDDARSLTWDFDEQPFVVGQPVVRLRVSASAPAASLSLKLCDVFPDGTSALITRGTLDLAFRAGPSPTPLVPGEVYDVEVVLDACAYRPDPGQRLRLSVAGSDWPNTIAPPAPRHPHRPRRLPVTPALDRAPASPRRLRRPGSEHSTEEPDGITWAITRDVLRRTTTVATHTVSSYDTPHDGTALEDYAGEVGVDRRTFAQWATRPRRTGSPGRTSTSGWSPPCGSTSAPTATTSRS